MLCLHNAQGMFRKLSRLYCLYLQIETWWVLFICKTFLFSNLETVEKCKEVIKHTMTTAIAIIYISYLMWYFIRNWKLLSENSQDPLFPRKSASHPFFPALKIFQPLLQKRGKRQYICWLFKMFMTSIY